MSHSIPSCCISGHLHDGTPEGIETEIAGLKCYVAAPPGGSKEHTILYITDIFGIDLPNPRLLADEYAKAGFYVIVPDFLEGNAVPIEYLTKLVPTVDQSDSRTAEENANNKNSAYGVVGPWLQSNSPHALFPSIQKFVSNLRSDPSYKHIGAVGFCWGGWPVVKLVQAAAEPNVDAGVSCHPGFLEIPEDAEKVDKPLEIHVGTLDEYLPAQDVEKVKEVFKEKDGCEIYVYDDQVHGFAARGDLKSEKDRKAKEKVAERTIEFFKKYLK